MMADAPIKLPIRICTDRDGTPSAEIDVVKWQQVKWIIYSVSAIVCRKGQWRGEGQVGRGINFLSFSQILK